MKQSNNSKAVTINVITMGVKFEAGHVYGTSWFSDGVFGYNDICYIPKDERDPRAYFFKWLETFAQFIESINVDIHVKELPLQ